MRKIRVGDAWLALTGRLSMKRVIDLVYRIDQLEQRLFELRRYENERLIEDMKANPRKYGRQEKADAEHK
jgi:hypothetical protein